MAKRTREGAAAPADDAVGYGRPPREHRFREGTVPNPWGRKGRPKSKVDFLDERLRLRIDGRERWITRDEALDHALYREAMTGNVSAAKELQARRNLRQAEGAGARQEALAAEDAAALQRFLDRERAADDGGAAPERGTERGPRSEPDR